MRKLAVAIILTMVFSLPVLAAGSMEHVTSIRPATNGYLWFAHPLNPGPWNNNDTTLVPDGSMLPTWGWGNGAGDPYNHLADGMWADFNGDGIDDKVNVSPVVDGGSGNLAALQIATAYSSVDGDFWSNFDVFPPNGHNLMEWNAWPSSNTVSGFAEVQLVFGDLDGDGIDDNAGVVRQNGPDDGMPWRALLSAGAPGIAGWTSAENDTGWQIFGQEKNEACTGDINGDGYADRIIWEHQIWPNPGDPCTDVVYVWVAVDYSGAGVWGDSFIDEYALLWGGIDADYDPEHIDLQVTDINGDGMDDMAVALGRPDVDNSISIFGYYTKNENLTGPAADGTDLPTSEAWGGMPDVTSVAGFINPASGDRIRYAALTQVGFVSDLDGDGDVDILDLSIVAANWLSGRGFENRSFEDDAIDDNTSLAFYFNGDGSPDFDHLNVPKNWQMNGASGKVIDPNDQAVLQPTEGENYIWFESTSVGNLAQFEGGYGSFFIDPNTVYTFTADVAWSPEYDTLGGWYWMRVQSLDDSDIANMVWTQLGVVHQNIVAPTVNAWTTVGFSFDTANFPGVAGTHLLMDLQGQNIYFDNIRFQKADFPDFDGDQDVDLQDFAVISDEFGSGQ